MKQLLTRIQDLERSVVTIVGHISTLKEENEILSTENNRLTVELNQLRKSGISGATMISSSADARLESSKSDINIDQIKTNLDQCIEEIEECLRQMLMMKKPYHVYSVTILGREYPVKCTPEEEEQLKVVEKNLNTQLNQYRLKYVQLDKQDCLSMALIENLMDQLLSRQDETQNEIDSTLDSIEGMLAAHLS